jgi:hypothetical protein
MEEIILATITTTTTTTATTAITTTTITLRLLFQKAQTLRRILYLHPRISFAKALAIQRS